MVVDAYEAKDVIDPCAKSNQGATAVAPAAFRSESVITRELIGAGKLSQVWMGILAYADCKTVNRSAARRSMTF